VGWMVTESVDSRYSADAGSDTLWAKEWLASLQKRFLDAALVGSIQEGHEFRLKLCGR
jgi:hypothetical protein